MLNKQVFYIKMHVLNIDCHFNSISAPSSGKEQSYCKNCHRDW